MFSFFLVFLITTLTIGSQQVFAVLLRIIPAKQNTIPLSCYNVPERPKIGMPLKERTSLHDFIGFDFVLSIILSKLLFPTALF